MLLNWASIRFDFRLIRLLLGFLLITGFSLGCLGCEPEVILSSTLNLMPFSYLTAEELKEMIDRGKVINLVDVRSFQEYLTGHLPGAVSIPYRQLTYRYRELNPKITTVVYCRTGQTSLLATQTLARLGFSNLYSLNCGFAGWEYAVELSDGRQLV
jgi:rhodanese-related sulfurtransferase